MGTYEETFVLWRWPSTWDRLHREVMQSTFEEMLITPQDTALGSLLWARGWMRCSPRCLQSVTLWKRPQYRYDKKIVAQIRLFLNLADTKYLGTGKNQHHVFVRKKQLFHWAYRNQHRMQPCLPRSHPQTLLTCKQSKRAAGAHLSEDKMRLGQHSESRRKICQVGSG